MKLELHPIQAKILTKLLFHSNCRYTELNVDGIDSDRFNFHIKRLTELNVITKNTKGRYELTIKGKELANRFDTEKHEIEQQAKLGVLVMALKVEKSQTHYLIQKRLKQPYYGYYGFVTGKIKWGETIFEAGLRELYEETALEGDLELVGIKHKMDYDIHNAILEDKFFYVLKATNLIGTLAESFEGGENNWMTMEEIKKTEDLFPDVLLNFELLEDNAVTFEENKYTVNTY